MNYFEPCESPGLRRVTEQILFSAGNLAQLNSTALQLFPELGSLDPELHDGANSAVQIFLSAFCNGYCIIRLPIGSYGQAYAARNRHFLRVKLLNLMSNLLFIRGQHVCSSRWHIFDVQDSRIVGTLKFEIVCARCHSKICYTSSGLKQNLFSPGIAHIDLRICNSSEIWLNIASELPSSNECTFCLNLHGGANIAKQARFFISCHLLLVALSITILMPTYFADGPGDFQSCRGNRKGRRQR